MKSYPETRKYHIHTFQQEIGQEYAARFILGESDDYVREGRKGFSIAEGGDAYWTPQIISKIFYQAQTGKIPVSGAGFGGRFSDKGFDDIWFDMSEIVRPTRDGIHGREYVSTIVNLGQKPAHIQLVDGKPVKAGLNIDLAFPVIFGTLPLPAVGNGVQIGILKAAKKLGTLAYLDPKTYTEEMRPYLANAIVLETPGAEPSALLKDAAGVEFLGIPSDSDIEKAKAQNGDLLICARVCKENPESNLDELTKKGIGMIHISASYYGMLGKKFVTEAVEDVHKSLTKKGKRNTVSILVSGGIADAEHVPKIITRGADAVCIDFVIAAALGCSLWADEAYPCPVEHKEYDPDIACQRLMNLFAAWRNQTLEVMGAMGIREIRRMRGEKGRTMSYSGEREEFKKLFSLRKKGSLAVLKPGNIGDFRWTPEILRATMEMASSARLPESEIEYKIGASDGGFDRLRFIFEEKNDFKDLFTEAEKKELDLSILLNKRDNRPKLSLPSPVYSGGMSFGSVSLNVMKGRAIAAQKLGSYMSTGEGGYPDELIPYKDHVITQVATGLFGVTEETIQRSPIVEFKYAQGAKPGLGGHLLASKVSGAVAKARGSVEGVSLFSPFPFHSVYSVEDHKKHVDWIKTVNPRALICVKVSTPTDVDMVAVGSYYAGAHMINIDGSAGGTGAAPDVSKKNIAYPIEFAVTKVHKFLEKEGIRDEVVLAASGGIRTAFDVAKSIALGADCVQVGTSDIVALGCERLGACEKATGCPLGITTTDPKMCEKICSTTAADRIVNLRRSWATQLKGILLGLGMRSIHELRGRTDVLEYIE